MKSQTRYAAIGVVGLSLMVAGSLIFAAASNGDGDNTFGRVFGASLAVSFILAGVGLAIAAAATHLARRE